MIVFNTSGDTAFKPNRRLFLSWQLIINCAKARGKAGTTTIESHPKWLARKIGDVSSVAMSGTMKKGLPHRQRTNGAQKQKAKAAFSIISAYTIDGNLCHKEVCAALLPYVSGWERIFVGEVAKLENLGAIRKAKLLAIIEAILENPPRLCRYCSSKVSIVAEYSYYCPKCGDCLNLNWGGEQ